jgi:hypothetical protein
MSLPLDVSWTSHVLTTDIVKKYLDVVHTILNKSSLNETYKQTKEQDVL